MDARRVRINPNIVEEVEMHFDALKTIENLIINTIGLTQDQAEAALEFIMNMCVGEDE